MGPKFRAQNTKDKELKLFLNRPTSGWVQAAATAKSLQSSDSLQPHRRQPNRLLCPWDSLGKNTGVGCHFLLQCMKVKSESEVAQSCPTLCNPMDCSPPGSSVHGIFQARVLEWGAIEFRLSPVLTLTKKSVRYPVLELIAWWDIILSDKLIEAVLKKTWKIHNTSHKNALLIPTLHPYLFFWRIFFFQPYHLVCRILIPWHGIEFGPWQWKCWILIIRSTRNSVLVGFLQVKFSFVLR